MMLQTELAAPVTVAVLHDHGLFDQSNARNMKRFEIGDTSVRFLAFACEGPKCWRIELWANKTKVCENPTVGRLKVLLAALSPAQCLESPNPEPLRRDEWERSV